VCLHIRDSSEAADQGNRLNIYSHKGSDCRKRMAANNGTSLARIQPPSAPGSHAFQGMCFRCKKKGHKVQDCPVKNKNNSEGANLSRGAETDEIHPNLWIGDMGATSHMTCCKTGLFNVKPCNHSVLVGDGRSLKVVKVGKLKLVFEGKGQETTEVILEDVKFMPKLKVNLFNFTMAMKKGAKIYTEGTSMIREEGKYVVFGNNISMGSSFLVAARVKLPGCKRKKGDVA
jgi:hypothetical protein